MNKPKKNVVQDVVPGKKSIRNVTLSSRQSITPKAPSDRVIPSKHREEDDEFTRPVALKQAPMRIEPTAPVASPPPVFTPPPPKPPTLTPTYTYDYAEPKKPRKKWLYVAIAALVIVVFFGISAFFKSAVIRITPKESAATLNNTFKAIKDTTGATLGFQIVTVSKEVEKTVPATGEQEVDKKASGTIVIYNETAQTQKLVATTRFETPEGLIFRLPTAVTVPAKTTVSGNSVAGSVEVTVQADQTGSSYNIGLKDFTLPGLKGDPKYTTVYARSKTEMTGGFSGKQKIVSPDVLNQADTDLTSSLKDGLAKDITAQIPANFVLYTPSLSYSLSDVEQASSTPDGVVLEKKGTTSAVIFDRSALSKTILAQVASNVSPDTLEITNLDALTFSYATGTPFNPASDITLNFNLAGNVSMMSTVDQNKLKADLLGLSRTKANLVLANYDSIQEAWVETHPFWNATIPSDPAKVTIVNTLTK